MHPDQGRVAGTRPPTEPHVSGGDTPLFPPPQRDGSGSEPADPGCGYVTHPGYGYVTYPGYGYVTYPGEDPDPPALGKRLLPGEPLLLGEPLTHRLTTYPGAQLAALSELPLPSGQPRPQRGGGLRGTVSSTFTPRHRANMEERLGRLRLDAPFLFVTLTYLEDRDRHPEHGFPTEPAAYKGDLDRFLDRLGYLAKKGGGGIGAVWRLEFRWVDGSPHFHLVVYGLREALGLGDAGSLDAVLGVAEAAWFGAIGWEGPPGDAVRVTEPETVGARRRALAYLAKRDPRQLASPFIAHAGRSWGAYGKAHLPEAAPVEVDLTASEAARLRRSMVRYRDKTSRRRLGKQAHNPGVRLRRGAAGDWDRYARMVEGEREWVDAGTGEVIRAGEADRSNGGGRGVEADRAVSATPSPSPAREGIEDGGQAASSPVSIDPLRARWRAGRGGPSHPRPRRHRRLGGGRVPPHPRFESEPGCAASRLSTRRSRPGPCSRRLRSWRPTGELPCPRGPTSPSPPPSRGTGGGGEKMAREGFVGWLRNVDRKEWALYH